MARRGSFGRSRGRGSSNLAALVSALLKEQRAATDRVMFDAWQNGGVDGDGQPVSDGRLLGYIKSRRDGFSKDDPMYADWDNRLTQYDFSIGEKTIDLAFKEGKATEKDVAAFYRGKLAGMPNDDSAFYREVAGRAAQWTKAEEDASASRLKEQETVTDRLMFDAWQNGGQVDGKAVSDDRLLDHIKTRRDAFGRDDPMWSDWDNRLTQYDFSIEQKKTELAFNQGKITAGDVASFYRDRLKTIPKDSAFYREVEGAAAQWAKSEADAKAAGSGGGGGSGGGAGRSARGRATGALRDKLNGVIQKAADYEALNLALTQYAQAQGIIAGNQTLSDADATDLRDMFERGIYVGEDALTFEDFQSSATDYYKNLSTQVDIQVQLGNQGVTARNKRDKFLTQTLVRLNTIDERSQYEMARENWMDASEAAAGDPYAQQAADDRYLSLLTDIRDNASSNLGGPEGNDPEFVGGLLNEINAIATGKATGPTVTDLMSNTGEGVVTADADDSAEKAASKYGDIESLNKGTAYFGQTEPGGPLSVIEWEGGNQATALGFDDSLQPSLSTIAGEKRLVYLKGEAVTASSIVDSDGNVIDRATLTPEQLRRGFASEDLVFTQGAQLGYIFRNPNGTTKYGVKDAEGNLQYTDVNPWADANGQGFESGFPGEGVSVFTSEVEYRGDKIVPIYNKPVDFTNMDPLLADSTVAPKDLLALSANGIKGFSDDDVAAYRERLTKREQERTTALSNRDLGLQDRMGIGQKENPPGNRSGNMRASILEGMDAVRDVTQGLFGAGKAADDLYVPPTPRVLGPNTPASPSTPASGFAASSPSLPASGYAQPPSVSPTTTASPSPLGSLGYSPMPTPRTTPPPTTSVVDRGADGRGAGGTWTPTPTVTIVDRGADGRGAGGTWGSPTFTPTPGKKTPSAGL